MDSVSFPFPHVELGMEQGLNKYLLNEWTHELRQIVKVVWVTVFSAEKMEIMISELWQH